MCGRTCCNLAPEVYCKASAYKDDANQIYLIPQWRELNNCNNLFHPSANICPGNVTPVLLEGTYFSKTNRIIAPMLWGMIPQWHKGDANNHGLKTINCRFERLSTSKLYSTPLQQGNRCIAICEGFYEWQSSQNARTKQPYFIYAKQKELVEDVELWNHSHFDEQSGWKGPQLLKLAALFSIWNSSNGDEIYSYSIITMDSGETFSSIHHRIPAIIQDEYVQDWLDFNRVSSSRALTLLTSTPNISWHPVSTHVNNSRHKDVQCNQRIIITNPPLKQTSLQMWLNSSVQNKCSSSSLVSEKTENKKLKR